MSRTCTRCRRVNPNEALYCYHDGLPLASQAGGDVHAAGGAIDVGARPFTIPFVLSSGRKCQNFNELAVALVADKPAALELLGKSYLEPFLAGQGRTDLADAAHAAAHASDREGGLDEFLGRLPATVVRPAKLRVEPAVIDLGTVPHGTDQRCELVLHNEGMRLLQGSASCEGCPWLSLGDGPVLKRKRFQLSAKGVLPVRLLGRHLRAFAQPQEAEIQLDSNGGRVAVKLRVQVSAQPFSEGVLAGALSPRQLAEKARAAPNEAAVLIESGAVARWYEANGWVYPVKGPIASGRAAVQQLFEALGLVRPPRVELSAESVQLNGNPGETVESILAVFTQEQRSVVAHGTSNQPWLRVGPTIFRGSTATLPLTVPAVPGHPGDTLQAVVSITANGDQRFVVPVVLMVGKGKTEEKTSRTPAAPAPAPAARPVPPPAAPPRSPAPGPLPAARSGWPVGVLTLLATLLLPVALLGVVYRDYRAPAGSRSGAALQETDATPRIAIRFHDVKRDDELEKLWLSGTEPTRRFGVVMLRKGQEVGKGAALKRLTFDPWGRTNNTCLGFDAQGDRLFGSSLGHWEERANSWKDNQGQEHQGDKSVWLCNNWKLRVTQLVELVRGAQSNLLDTCRVRYLIENLDSKEHQVAIRFLLDSYIGGNDGVPFTIPGESDLCDTMKDLPDQAKDKKLPNFLQALEKPDLAHPGTIAHLRLKLEGLEPPSRVTLGAWPHEKLRILNLKADGLKTLSNVPLLPMKSLDLNDSAIVIYWKSQPLKPGAKREVGFEYGLGSLASTGSRLAATVDGSFRPNGELTVVAYVNQADQGDDKETVTLTLPSGFKLLDGAETQPVPRLPPDAKSRNRPVTWKVQAGNTGKHEFTIQTSAGSTQTLPVEIKSTIFD